MADDQALWANSVYGDKEFQTPNMEFLAANGIQFNQGYTVSPVCSPSRASFFTGRLPSQHGIHDFLSENDAYDHGWLDGELLLSEILQRSGYQTALIGKWHATTNSAKVQRGFDRWLSYDVQPSGWSNQYLHSGLVHFSDQGKPAEFEGYQSHYLTQQAINYLKERDQQKPFFLFIGYVDTHAPFEGQSKKWVDHYQKSSFESIPVNESSHLPPNGLASEIPQNHHEQLAQYYAGVSMMDEQLGLILDYLKRTSQLDSTLLIYTSDHGHMNGHHGLYGKGNATKPQNLYQESVTVPLLMHWPLGIDKISNPVDEPVNQCDLFQTFLDVSESSLSKEERERINSPGENILSHLKDINSNWTPYQFSEFGNARMIANGDFKLVKRYQPLFENYGDEFYDLSNDPREHENLIDHPDYADQVAAMTTELEEYFSKYETSAHTGTDILDQLPANGNEPWRFKL